MNLVALAVGIAALVLFSLGLVLPTALRLPRRLVESQSLPPLPAIPTIEVLVPAYLEVGEMQPKVRDVRTARSTASITVTVVASDSATADAARAAGADAVFEVAREGKPSAINFGVQRSTADIIVLTDANCTIDPASWPEHAIHGLAHFAIVSANKAESGGAESLFWAMERRLKRASVDLSPTVGVAGEFIAFRRRHFRPIPSGTLVDDMWMVKDFASRGLFATVDGRIRTVELPASRAEQWERRLRICEGVFAEILPRIGPLLGSSFGRLLISHKLYRTTIGCAAFWLAMGCFALVYPPWSALLVTTGVAGAVGWYAGLIRWNLPASQLLAPVGMQAIPVVAAIRSIRKQLRGTTDVGWKKVPR